MSTERSAGRRVLVTTSTLPRFQDDPEPRFILDLARHLPEHWETVILAPAAPDTALVETLEGVEIRRYRYAPFRALEVLAYPGAIMPRVRARPLLWPLVPLMLIGLALATRRLLRSGNFDLVHCHWLVPQGMVQALCVSGSPPFVVTSHGGDLFTFSSPRQRSLLRKIVRRASALTVVSQDLARAAASLPMQGAGAPRVIPMGVDRGHFHPALRVKGFYQQFGLAGPVILFVGRIADKKGLRYLLEAMGDERLARQGAGLAVVGDGPLRQSLQAYSRSLGLVVPVHFLGAIPHSELAHYYASADIFCAPSVTGAGGDKDGLPTVLLEACACGLPCISTPIGGIPELLEDKVNARLVPPRDSVALADTLVELLANHAGRRALGQAAREATRPFDWSIIAARYAGVYDQALDASTGAQATEGY